MSDYEWQPLGRQWVHPETGVTINSEDMPWELKPCGAPFCKCVADNRPCTKDGNA